MERIVSVPSLPAFISVEKASKPIKLYFDAGGIPVTSKIIAEGPATILYKIDKVGLSLKTKLFIGYYATVMTLGTAGICYALSQGMLKSPFSEKTEEQTEDKQEVQAKEDTEKKEETHEVDDPFITYPGFLI